MKKIIFAVFACVTLLVIGCAAPTSEPLGKTRQALTGSPPTPQLTTVFFNDMSGCAYDSTNKRWNTCFSGDSTPRYAIATIQSGVLTWEYTTSAAAGTFPLVKIPSLTADIIARGSYNSTTRIMSYSSHTYKFRLQRNTSTGDLEMVALQLT